MLQKRQAIEWNCAVPETKQGKRVKEEYREPMDIEFECDGCMEPVSIMKFEDEDSLLEKIKGCRYLTNPLFNDARLLDREIVYGLVSAVLYASE